MSNVDLDYSNVFYLVRYWTWQIECCTSRWSIWIFYKFVVWSRNTLSGTEIIDGQ